MKVLVVGAAGQVGHRLIRRTLARNDVAIAGFNMRQPVDSGVVSEHVDKTDERLCHDVVTRHRPDVVIDTGALHNVDYCEVHPEEADRVNRDGTRFLAEAAREVGSTFVFVSTDFVFDGTRLAPYRESDAPHPESRYARSKLGGEEATLAASTQNLVVRPSVIFSWWDTRIRQTSSSGKGMNFATWLLEEVAHGRPVRIVRDQVASPTLADDVAGAIFALLDHRAHGTFHTAGASPLTRYEFSRKLVQRLGFDHSLVSPVMTSELRQAAKRPANSSLSSALLREVTGYSTMDLPTALDRFARDFEHDPGAPRPAPSAGAPKNPTG
jgi:dTDP-4-dehydrorhamnose reductase